MASSSAPSLKACDRLQKELTEWLEGPPRAGFKLISSDCPQRGIIEVIGAPGTLHENEKCQLQISFPEQYPQEAPEVIYLHPVLIRTSITTGTHMFRYLI